METVYEGPTCPVCAGDKYTKHTYGASDYKRCIECKRLSKIEETDNLVEVPAQ